MSNLEFTLKQLDIDGKYSEIKGSSHTSQNWPYDAIEIAAISITISFTCSLTSLQCVECCCPLDRANSGLM